MWSCGDLSKFIKLLNLLTQEPDISGIVLVEVRKNLLKNIFYYKIYIEKMKLYTIRSVTANVESSLKAHKHSIQRDPGFTYYQATLKKIVSH